MLAKDSKGRKEGSPFIRTKDSKGTKEGSPFILAKDSVPHRCYTYV